MHPTTHIHMKCSKCLSQNVRLIDNERLEQQEQPNVSGIDTEIYATLFCDDCRECTSIVGDITWRAQKLNDGTENKLFNRVDLSGRGMHYNIDAAHILDDDDEHEDDEEFIEWVETAESGDEYTEFHNRKYVCL